MPKSGVFLLIVLIASCKSTESIPQGPRLGVLAVPEQIANWSIGVFPDGTGLPIGNGNALAGKKIYRDYCQSCHGPEGIGDSAEELAGGEHGLTHSYPDKTIGTYWPYATTIFDFIRRAMPLSAPGSLSNDEVYAVTAYLLFLNGIIDQMADMNQTTLPRVIMPNLNGFIINNDLPTQ